LIVSTFPSPLSPIHPSLLLLPSPRYALLAPLTRDTCGKYGATMRSKLPFLGVHMALVGGSIMFSNLLARYFSRLSELDADDNVSDAAAARALLHAFEEENARAQRYMIEDLRITDPDAQRKVYLREDPDHPPLPDRIDRLRKRIAAMEASPPATTTASTAKQ
jgi:Zn-dependent protease with chaperone function